MAQSAIRATVRTVTKGKRLLPRRAALDMVRECTVHHFHVQSVECAVTFLVLDPKSSGQS